jgi:VanZ family protein
MVGPPRYRGAMTRSLAWLLLAAVAAFTLVPPAWRPLSRFPHNVEHIAVFLLLGIVFARAYPERPYIFATTAVVVVGILEALQLVVPGRHATLKDFVINAAALCTGIAIATLIKRLRPQRDHSG